MSQQRRLSYLLLLNMCMIIGLVVIGITAHSLGVLAAGGDFAVDSIAIMLGLLAVYLRDKHGKHRAPTYVALINGLLLLGVIVVIAVQGVDRLLHHSPEINGLPVLIVSAVSMIVMFIGVLILGKSAGSEDIHMRSVLLDTISDGLAAAGVAIVGGVIYFSKGLFWLDSAAALAISAVVGYGAIKLLKDVYGAIKRGSPLRVSHEK